MNRTVGIVIIVLLVLVLGSAGIFGFMWGKQVAENKTLRQEKASYKESISRRDSVIAAREKRVVLLQDSFSRLVKEAMEENTRADRRIILIKEDEDEMRKEIDDVHYVSDDSLIRLFNRLADSYEPPR